MKTLALVSEVLAERATRRNYGKMQLAADAGITYRTLSHVLSGERDFKVSTLMTVADRLGLELVLVPKEARAMFPPDLEGGPPNRDCEQSPSSPGTRPQKGTLMLFAARILP